MSDSSHSPNHTIFSPMHIPCIVPFMGPMTQSRHEPRSWRRLCLRLHLPKEVRNGWGHDLKLVGFMLKNLEFEDLVGYMAMMYGMMSHNLKRFFCFKKMASTTETGDKFRTPHILRHIRKNWLVVWNIFYFPIYWEESSQLTFIFFRGVAQPPTSKVCTPYVCRLLHPLGTLNLRQQHPCEEIHRRSVGPKLILRFDLSGNLTRP